MVNDSQLSRTCLAPISQVSRRYFAHIRARHVRDTCETRARRLQVIYPSITTGLPVNSGGSKNIQKMIVRGSKSGQKMFSSSSFQIFYNVLLGSNFHLFAFLTKQELMVSGTISIRKHLYNSVKANGRYLVPPLCLRC